MRRRSAGHDPFEVDEGELNLTPYLDIITTLVIFMIFTFQVVIEFKLIDVFQPAEVGGGDGGGPDTKIRATLMITPEAILCVAAGGEVSASERIDAKGKGSYDYGRLRQVLGSWKDELKLDEQITIAADPSIEYSTIIATMDAIRRDEKRWLFPDVVFGPAVKPDGGAPQ